jgi:hypothetical protein
MLSLLVMAGGVVGAAAQGAGPYFENALAKDYPLHAVFIGTNAPLVAYAAGLPEFTGTDLRALSGAVATDGTGHVDGLVYARVYLGDPSNHTNVYGAFTIRVTGKLGKGGQLTAHGVKIKFVDFPIDIPGPGTNVPVKIGKGGVANGLVKMTLNGHGYTFAGLTSYPNASLSLKFTGTNVLVDIAPYWQVSVSSTNYSVTYADGSTESFTNGPATKTNSGISFITGKVKGNIKPGKDSPVNGGKEVKIDESAALVSAGTFWSVVNGTNFIERTFPGGLIVDALTNIDAQVIQPIPGSKLWLNANVGSHSDLFAGTGTANYDAATWSATLSGVAFLRGATLHAKGTLGPAIVGYDPVPGTTNFVARIVPDAIQQVTITSGKIYGQKIPKMEGFNLPPPPP